MIKIGGSTSCHCAWRSMYLNFVCIHNTPGTRKRRSSAVSTIHIESTLSFHQSPQYPNCCVTKVHSMCHEVYVHTITYSSVEDVTTPLEPGTGNRQPNSKLIQNSNVRNIPSGCGDPGCRAAGCRAPGILESVLSALVYWKVESVAMNRK